MECLKMPGFPEQGERSQPATEDNVGVAKWSWMKHCSILLWGFSFPVPAPASVRSAQPKHEVAQSLFSLCLFMFS